MDRMTGYRAVSLAAGLLLVSIAQADAAEVVAIASVEQMGMLEVSVQVDGLSCPFCAYGLQKKLRKVGNIAELKIQVDEGRAVLQPKEGTSLDLAEVERAVRDGGFTPHGITLTARGRLTEFNGVPALELPGDTLLLLADDAQTSALLESASNAAGAARPVIWVAGEAELEERGGHAGHPYTLSVSSFEIS